MYKGKKIIVLIPAYNAEVKILEVFNRLLLVDKYFDEVIVLDDGSIDNTLNLIKEIKNRGDFERKITVLRHMSNIGYGGAQKNLYKYFFKRNGDIGVLIHSDGQYPPERLKEIIDTIIDRKVDIVLGSRFYKNMKYYKEMPVYKIIGNKFLTLCANLVFRQKISEYHTGLRAYSKKTLMDIDFLKFSDGFTFDNEILFRAIKKKMKIMEIPTYAKYEGTRSNVSVFLYGIRILKAILKHYLT